MKFLLKIYRFFSKGKVSSMRLLLYVGFGFILSKDFTFTLYSLDLLLVFTGILFASILNDYFDYKYLGELNAIGKMLKEKKIKESTVYLSIILPGILPFILFYLMWEANAPSWSLIMLLVSFMMSILYCAPPFRFKEKKIVGLLLPPLGIYLLFFQGVLLSGIPDKVNLIIAGNIFLFSWYLEFLHLADDALEKNEYKKLNFIPALKLAKAIIILSFIINAYFAWYFTLILIPVFFSLYRFIKLQYINENNLKENRHNLLSGIYRIEEFIILAIFIIIQNPSYNDLLFQLV